MGDGHPKRARTGIEELYSETDVYQMFSTTVRTYDFLNHLFSFGIDRSWRRRLVAKANVPADGSVADLCTGTGDVAIALTAGRPDVRVTGVDYAQTMLERAREKIERRGLAGRVELVCADALSLPFPDGSFDAAIVAFGLRNLPDWDAGIREMARIVRPGGSVAILEFAPPPDTLFGRLYRWYLRHVMPPVGSGISGYWSMYGYLYSSITHFLTPDRLEEALLGAGLRQTGVERLTGGIAYVHSARKPER